jgi:hypothetical protein
MLTGLWRYFNNSTAQRDCRKTEILKVAPGQALEFSRGQRWNRVTRLRKGLDQRPEDVDFADIVNQGEPLPRPLYIHFTFGAQSEAEVLALRPELRQIE